MSSTVPLFEGPKAAYDGALDVGYTFTGTASFVDSAASAHGIDSWVFQVKGDGVTASPSLRTPFLAVKEGDALEISGWMRRATTATVSKGDLRLLTYDSSQASETVVMTKTPAGAAAVWIDVGTTTYIIPANVAFVRLECRINLTTPVEAEHFEWDDVAIRSPKGLSVIASGTLTVGPVAANSLGSASVTLTALGNGWTYTPGAQFFMRETTGGAVFSGSVFMGTPQEYYASSTDSGATDSRFSGAVWLATAYTSLSAGTPVVAVVFRNGAPTSYSLECRYYVMIEQGNVT